MDIDIDKEVDDFAKLKIEKLNKDVNDDSKENGSKEELDANGVDDDIDNKKVEKKESDTDDDNAQKETKVPDDENLKKNDDEYGDFTLESFNKAFKTEYKDKGEIESLFNSKDRITQLEGELKEKNSLLDMKSDVMNNFADESLYKVNKILIENKNLNKTIANKLVDADFDKMTDEQILVLNEMVERPIKSRRSESSLIENLKRKYDITADFEDLDEDEQATYLNNKLDMEDDASDARKKLSDIVNNIEMPEKRDLKAEQQKIDDDAQAKKIAYQESMSPIIENIIKDFDKMEIKDNNDDILMDFDVSDEFKSLLKKNLLDTAMISNIDPKDKKSVDGLKDFVEKEYYWANRKKIAHIITENALTKSRDESFQKYHSRKKTNDKEAPNNGAADAVRQQTYDDIEKELS